MAQQVRDQVTILRETFEDGSEKYAKGPMQQSDLKKRVLKVHDEFSGYTSSMRPLTEGMSNSDVDLVKKELKVLYKQLKGLGENPYQIVAKTENDMGKELKNKAALAVILLTAESYPIA